MAKKKSVDLFGDDTAARPTNEFEALLNATGNPGRRLKPGDRLRGEVLAVSGQEAFVSTGTSTDAVLPLIGDVRPNVGDVLDVIVVRANETEVLVKQEGARGQAGDTESLEDAFDMELPVEGTVLEVVKGGFRVKVMGQKAFCPVSQIDWTCKVAEDYVGRKYEFLITRMERGRDLVVSRRKLLDIERAASEGDFLRDAKEGDIFNAKVFRIEKYGAFVRLDNGVDGLIPISELSWNRINHPQEVVNLDQVVQVKLLQVREEGERLRVSFSLKQGGSTVDPWSTLTNDFPVGAQADGTVEKRENFGLFVNIAPGITGLLPRSSYRDAVEGKDLDSKRPGDRVRVRIDRIDLDARKLSFSLPREEEDDTWRGHAAAQGGGGKAQGFGTLADLLKGVKGR